MFVILRKITIGVAEYLAGPSLFFVCHMSESNHMGDTTSVGTGCGLFGSYEIHAVLMGTSFYFSWHRLPPRAVS